MAERVWDAGRPDIDIIIDEYKKSHNKERVSDIKRAFKDADQRHGNRKRSNGELEIYHPFRVARQIASWGFEADVIIAALLHDMVNNDVALENKTLQFGNSVIEIINAAAQLSDRAFRAPDLTQFQKESMADELLKQETNKKALYIKIADRIDNLTTVSVDGEWDLGLKVWHTKKVIIPMVRREHAGALVDKLEDLCLKIEKPAVYEAISEYREAGEKKYGLYWDVLDKVFNHEDDQKTYRRYREEFLKRQPRSVVSIYRQIAAESDDCTGIDGDGEKLSGFLNQSNMAMFDLTLILSDDLAKENSRYSPIDIFLKYYKEELEYYKAEEREKGFYLTEFRRTTDGAREYFVLRDKIDNTYRLFVQTRKENRRYQYGSINKQEPQDPYTEKITVFRKDGKPTTIDKGASVLDFAFEINPDYGCHFDYALRNESRAHLDPYDRLRPGDRIEVFTKDSIIPPVEWFKYVKTTKAVTELVRYFRQFYFTQPSKGMTIWQASSLVSQIVSGLDFANANDREMYTRAFDAAVEYAGIRARWSTMDAGTRQEKDATRTAAHDSLIAGLNILGRYMAANGKNVSWRKQLGDPAQNPECRKRIGDFACWWAVLKGCEER